MGRKISRTKAPNPSNSSKEEGLPNTVSATAMSNHNESETVKMTLYIKKPVVKEFKKLAIDKEMDYSQLATLAFAEFVQNHQLDGNS